MELVRLIRTRLGGTTAIDPKRLRHLKPIRNPIVEAAAEEGGAVLLTAPLQTQVSVATSILARWMKAPDTKSFELDPVGAFVWEQCDGKSTFESIAQRLIRQYKMNRLEAEVALASYLQTLSQKKLISFAPAAAPVKKQ